jgi:hypothetical protein
VVSGLIVEKLTGADGSPYLSFEDANGNSSRMKIFPLGIVMTGFKKCCEPKESRLLSSAGRCFRHSMNEHRRDIGSNITLWSLG